MLHGDTGMRVVCFAGLVSLGASASAPPPHPPGAQQYTVAFKSFAPDNSDIFVADADGSHARALVPDGALDYDASFSADGAWIVFTSHRSGPGKIYRVHPDGSGLQRLTDGPAFDDQGALSPDGRSLAFVSSRSGQADVWLLDLATHALHNVTRNPAGDFRPAWSRDGQWIAFSSDRDSKYGACPNTTAPGPAPFVAPQYLGVYVVHPDGTGLRRVSTAGEIAGTPHWSPDGRRLAFWAGDPAQVCRGGLIFGTGTTQIIAVDMTAGVRDTLTSGPGLKVFPRWMDASRVAYEDRRGIHYTSGSDDITGDFEAPDWSPDRRAIVFHRDVDARGDAERAFQPWFSPDPLFHLLRVPDITTFSPAGDRLVYLLTSFSGPVRSGALVMATRDGGDRKIIYRGPLTEDMAGPAWSPRGDVIAVGLGGMFQRAQSQPARVVAVSTDGARLTPLTDGSANDGMPSWSPDGSQVVFRRAVGLKKNLYILDVATHRLRRLETGSDFDTFPTWSPRGDWIVFTSKRDGDYEIYRIHPDGTGLRRLTHAPGADAHPSFSPDGEWIAFATARQGFKDEAVQLLLSGTFQPYGEIAVMRADGTDLRLLTDNSTEEGAPSWVPLRQR